ncbi:hypothetical protein JKP88DRAFT_272929 [Tribonema minus]|uniref:Ankyrin repeat protein n=1 Tax=Tribonema minus TaxID=303371 RepID=A0A836CF73_9STRA|nr:hypothetical protein JKP88DRAFT_272929 [Tribonema minus]
MRGERVEGVVDAVTVNDAYELLIVYTGRGERVLDDLSCFLYNPRKPKQVIRVHADCARLALESDAEVFLSRGRRRILPAAGAFLVRGITETCEKPVPMPYTKNVLSRDFVHCVDMHAKTRLSKLLYPRLMIDSDIITYKRLDTPARAKPEVDEVERTIASFCDDPQVRLVSKSFAVGFCDTHTPRAFAMFRAASAGDWLSVMNFIEAGAVPSAACVAAAVGTPHLRALVDAGGGVTHPFFVERTLQCVDTYAASIVKNFGPSINFQRWMVGAAGSLRSMTMAMELGLNVCDNTFLCVASSFGDESVLRSLLQMKRWGRSDRRIAAEKANTVETVRTLKSYDREVARSAALRNKLAVLEHAYIDGVHRETLMDCARMGAVDTYHFLATMYPVTHRHAEPAARRGCLPIVETVLRRGKRFPIAAVLTTAVQRGYADIVRLLIARKRTEVCKHAAGCLRLSPSPHISKMLMACIDDPWSVTGCVQGFLGLPLDTLVEMTGDDFAWTAEEVYNCKRILQNVAVADFLILQGVEFPCEMPWEYVERGGDRDVLERWWDLYPRTEVRGLQFLKRGTFSAREYDASRPVTLKQYETLARREAMRKRRYDMVVAKRRALMVHVENIESDSD